MSKDNTRKLQKEGTIWESKLVHGQIWSTGGPWFPRRGETHILELKESVRM